MQNVVAARRSVHEGMSNYFRQVGSGQISILVTDRQGATIVVFELVVPVDARIPR